MTTSSKSPSITPGIIGSKWHPKLQAKLIAPDLLALKIKELKDQGRKIVTLNGSFDLPHAGHLEILSQAYEQKSDEGILIVALNSDDSIRRYKSADRPVVFLEGRLQMMAAYLFVDYVTWFEENDPIALLEVIAPHIHVNGSEYGVDCIEAPTVVKNGGKIHIVEKIPGLSTSQLMIRIQGMKT